MTRALLAGVLASVLLTGCAAPQSAVQLSASPVSTTTAISAATSGDQQTVTFMGVWPYASDTEKDMLALIVRRIPGFATRAGGDFEVAELASQALGGTELRMLARLSNQARRGQGRSGGVPVHDGGEEVAAIW